MSSKEDRIRMIHCELRSHLADIPSNRTIIKELKLSSSLLKEEDDDFVLQLFSSATFDDYPELLRDYRSLLLPHSHGEVFSGSGVLLGCGSSGDVWFGTVKDELAAIKVFDRSSEARMWAENETHVYKSLEHLQGVCIPRLLSHGEFPRPERFTSKYAPSAPEVQGTPYIATSLEGRSFDSFNLPLPYGSNGMKWVVTAVEAFHEAGALHNGLSARNILVAVDGKGVRLVDFCHTELNADKSWLDYELMDFKMRLYSGLRMCSAPGTKPKNSSGQSQRRKYAKIRQRKNFTHRLLVLGASRVAWGVV